MYFSVNTSYKKDMGNNSLVESLWDSFVNAIESDGSNIMLVKYYNSFSFAKEKIKKLASHKDVIVIEHKFSATDMQSIAEPFMDSIRKIYTRYLSKEISVKEFVDKAGVYSMQKDAFVSYIEDGYAVRYEDPILAEVKYEYKRLMLSIASVLDFISKYKKLVYVISDLHYANTTALEFLKVLMSSDDKYNVNIFVNYNEGHLMEGENKSAWASVITMAQTENRLFESGVHEDTSKGLRVVEEFIPETANIREYTVKLANMVTFLCTRQADYYLKKLFQEIEKENVNVNSKERISLLLLYMANGLYSFDMSKTLLLGEELSSLLTEDMYKNKFDYYYILALAQAHLAQTDLAKKYVAECLKYGKLSENEILEFKAWALGYVINYYSWVDLFGCDYKENLDESIIKLFEEKKYYNTLNYILAFGYENDEKTARDIANGKKVPVHFDRALEGGKILDNKEFLLNAYMKNIILYNEYGHHKYVEELYKKRILITRQENEIVKIGHMYNGLGYNCIIDEQYIQANQYLNEALKINLECEQAQSCAETLYNMAMNCICAWDYENASKYLETSLNIFKCLNVPGVTVCNTSKLYGMLALCYYNLGMFYDSYLYVSKIELMASHILACETEPDYSKWDDDLFFYYMVRGLLAKADGEYEKACELLKRADFHQQRSKGLQYYSVAQLALERADVYYVMKEPKKAKEILEESIKYCRGKHLLSKMGLLMKKLDNEKPVLQKWELPLTATSLKTIEQMAENIGVKRQLKRKQKDIDFLTTWQETLGNDSISVDKMMNSSMMTIQNFFNLDGLVYIYTDGDNPMYSTDANLSISTEQVRSVIQYFKENMMAFVINREEKRFFDYEVFTEILGVNKAATIIGIPVYSNERLESVVIGYVNIHRNFTANKIVYNYDDLTILKFALIQLKDAINRLRTREELEKLNRTLSKNAITDLLTGLYNRQGFAEKISAGESKAKKYKTNVIAYIDFDNFKYYNDTFGHDVGDDVLVTFSRIVKQILGDNGYIVRYGGDEFVVVMPGKTSKSAVTFAKKLLKSFSAINDRVETIVPKGTLIPAEKRLSASIGISEFDEYNNFNVRTALNQADEALYFVKRTTKNDYMLYKEIPKH